MHTSVMRIQARYVIEIKMSISGLSNHLCVVVVTIISLIVASSTFHQVRATTESHDFINSRQYKRNLSVSKFRERPHWLPKYTWKPPEKFNGPRKRPSWEVDEVTETSDERKEREEFKEWEKKMREMTRREREKWKTSENIDRPESKSYDQILMPLKDVVVEENSTVGRSNEFSRSKKNNSQIDNQWSEKQQLLKNSTKIDVQQPFTVPSSEWKNHSPNNRWGMSVKEAPKDFLKKVTDESFNPTTSKALLEKNAVMTEEKNTSGTKETIRLLNNVSNGRWGMSVEDPSKRRYLKEPSTVSKTDLKNNSTDLGQSLNASRLSKESISRSQAVAGISSSRWGMSIKEVPKDFLKEISDESSAKTLAEKTPIAVTTEEKKTSKTKEAITLPSNLSNGRWGMSIGESSKRRFFSAPSNLSRSNIKNNSTDLGQSIKANQLNKETITAAGFSSGRWGMSTKEVPKEFLKEMSRRFQPSGNSNTVWKYRMPKGNIKIHGEQKDEGETEKVSTGTAGTKLSNGYPNGRWGIDVTTLPGDFLKQISSGGLTRLPTVYRFRIAHQRIDTNERNNPMSKELTLSTIPKISNDQIFLPSFLSVIKVSIVPRFFVIPENSAILNKL